MAVDRNIQRHSKRRVEKLRLLSNFFLHIEVVNIYIKTEIIHSFFENNPNADFNKLELFHLQYTDSVIELLNKIKKQKENEILEIIREMDMNETYIDKLCMLNSSSQFSLDSQTHSAVVANILSVVYENLTRTYKPYKLSELRTFSVKYAMTHYREEADIDYLLSDVKTKYYELDLLRIERKLLSRLYQAQFRIQFVCGYEVDNQIFELFDIIGFDDQFIWNYQTNSFYFLKEDYKLQLNRDKNIYEDGGLVSSLRRKNQELELEKEEIKKELPDEIIQLLRRYIETIDNKDLIDKIQDIDEQKNILQSMLDLNLN